MGIGFGEEGKDLELAYTHFPGMLRESVLRNCLLVLEAGLMERVGGRKFGRECLCGLLEMG